MTSTTTLLTHSVTPGRLLSFWSQGGAPQAKMTEVDGAHFSFPGDGVTFGWVKDELSRDADWGCDGFFLHNLVGVHFNPKGKHKPYDVSNANIITPRRRAMVRDLHEHALVLCRHVLGTVISYPGGFHWADPWRERTFAAMEKAYYKALWTVPAACDLAFDALTIVPPASKAWRLVTQNTYRRRIGRWGEPYPHAASWSAWREAGLDVVESSNGWARHGRKWPGRHLLIPHNDVAALRPSKRVDWVVRRRAEGFDVAAPVSRWFRQAGVKAEALR